METSRTIPQGKFLRRGDPLDNVFFVYRIAVPSNVVPKMFSFAEIYIQNSNYDPRVKSGVILNAGKRAGGNTFFELTHEEVSGSMFALDIKRNAMEGLIRGLGNAINKDYENITK